VHSAPSILVFALTSAGLGLALGTAALLLIVVVAGLLTGAGTSAYDQIGAGGISREGDYAGAAPPPAPDSPAAQAEREREIRQMLVARSERLVRRGQPALDVDAELTRLLDGERETRPSDGGLVEEVRALVLARNERRVRQGQEPLDVEREVARTLAELGP
jgi:hypothetical protein